MNNRENWLKRGLYWSAVLTLVASSTALEAKGEAFVAVSFTLGDSSVTVHEPVYVNFSARNDTAEKISFDLGFDRKEGFRFSITQPDGKTVQLPRYHRGGLALSGASTLGPGETYLQAILLNELYEITKPGEYWVTVKLEVPIWTRSGVQIAPGPPEKLRLLVADRDPRRLADMCERLAKTSTGPDYEAAREAAFALRFVQDPVAVPHLDRVLREGGMGVKGFAITGLARIGTPQAVEVLKSNLNTIDPFFRSQIEAALWEVKTGVKLQIND